MMRLIVTRQAKADLKTIFRYISTQNPHAAERVYREIRLAAQGLIEFPNIGKAGRVDNTFEFFMSEFPYVLVYCISKNDLVLIAVFHNKMDLNRHIENRKNL